MKTATRGPDPRHFTARTRGRRSEAGVPTPFPPTDLEPSPTDGLPGRRCRGDAGAAAVEFAMVAPFLFLVIFGIIEFGFSFGQWLDVRHGAREASRLTAVSYQNPASPHTGASQTTMDIIPAACARMDIAKGDTVSITLPNGPNKGAVAQVTVSKQLQQITGFLSPWLSGKSFSSTVQTRLEKAATFTAGSGTCT